MKFSLDDVQAFADFLAGEEKSPATVEKYVREVMGFAVWLGGRDLDRTMALDYKDALAEKRSPAGVNGAVAAVNALFMFLHMPECRIKAVKVQRDLFRDENQVLSENDYRRLLDAARKKNNLRLMLVMESICATGIRVSELRFFTVEAVRMGKASVTNKGKTRTVFLPKSLQKKLIKYARQMGISAGPVFVTRGGLPLDRSNIWHEMKKLCKDAGVDEGKVFPHNLRHLFARTFYGIEKDIVRLADVLGHSNVNTTRIYIMDSGDSHRRMLEKMRLVV